MLKKLTPLQFYVLEFSPQLLAFILVKNSKRKLDILRLYILLDILGLIEDFQAFVCIISKENNP